MHELSIKPRKYQEEIFKTTKEKNTLVVLPTGTGKTLIGIMTAIYKFKMKPLEKILMLAPTRPLIEQHFKDFKEKLPDGWADYQLFTGKTLAKKRKEIWQTAEFIFSTPQCISNDLKKGLYDLKDVSLLIVDEAHRCMKNYAYNHVSQKYKLQNNDHHILALTASPGGDKKTIEQICENLNIQSVEIRTRESDDVKPYLQELEFEKIFVDFPAELMQIKILLEGIYNDKAAKLKDRKLLFGHPNKMTLLKLQTKLASEIRRSRNGNKMYGISLCAQALKISHAIELVETQTVNALLEYMRDLYKKASEKATKGVQIITQDKRFQRAFALASSLQSEHPKVEKLKEIIDEQLKVNKDSKLIVFAQYRETLRKIYDVIGKNKLARPGIFVGQAQKKNSKGQMTGLKQKEQKKMIEDFKEGKINILLATSIAEEGLDIPEVSAVIFYEPVPSAIRKIQRAGRTARLAPGMLKILITKNTRDEIYYYSSHHKEKRMHKAIDEIKKGFDNPEKQKKLF
jgi:Fanconi anemia group M protein